MKNKSVNLSKFILAGVIFSILYIFLAAKPLTKEYHFTPEWKINVLNPTVSEHNPNEKLMHFRLGQNLGYFSETGKLTLYKSFPAKAAISDSYFATYNANASNTEIYLPDGTKSGNIQGNGYPYFKENQVFLFLPGGSSFAYCTQTGEIKWKYEGTIPITAFNSNENYSAAGFADGTIKVFDNSTGSVDINFSPGGSDFSVILGIDISLDGQYIASISGHEKKRFVISHREESQPKIIYHTFLNEASPYRADVHFCKDGKRVIYNAQNNLGIFDLSLNKNTFIPINSRIISIEESSNLVFLLGKKDKTYTVYVVEKTNTLEGQFSFEADSAFINTVDDNLFVGKDTTISKISLTRQ